MDVRKESLEMHKKWRGKIRIEPVARATNKEELSLAYTPGVAEPCLAIANDPSLSYELTRRWNTVAVITDGTAILGLGDIGGVAGMPVMEGKCLLFREFADIDAIPLCVSTKDTDEFVNTVKNISESFGGINLEDIAAPRCFEIERRLKEVCSVPIFHDDQHGTAIIVAAALLNALKLVNKKIEDIKLIICGAGAAGSAIGRHIANVGCKNIIYVDKNGAIADGMEFENSEHYLLAKESNPMKEKGSLTDVIKGTDAIIGVSRPNLITKQMISSMASSPIVFPLANPTPEIMPEDAKDAGASVVGTGRSDYPNQINNVLAFPGIFRGVLDCRASDINEEMKLSATYALASLISDDELTPEYIIPSPFDERVVPAVCAAVIDAARRTKVANR